ncbi:MAG TPA: hypothetical protein VMS86_03275 [Thermoanaerobaculia bacterium]|nr:hypothetical protein [Thermoanaerobaculia bacterium]
MTTRDLPRVSPPPTGTAETTGTAVEVFAFRPWVRSTCVKAMVWGMGVLGLLAAVAWLLRDPSEGVFGKAFTVLLGYALLFWASLWKIWWTAGRPAIEIDAETLAYRPLQYFSPRRVRFDGVLACGPRPGTESLRLVVDQSGRERELFLNLAVVKDKHRLLEVVGERLERAGLRRDDAGWARPG